MSRRINPTESIVKHFSNEYDKAVVTFLREHHNTPAGEEVPRRISTLLTGTRTLSNEERLYERVAKCLLKVQTNYVNDPQINATAQTSSFTHFGGGPGYLDALERHSYLPKDQFIQLTRRHHNDLYSQEAHQEFHVPMKQKAIKGFMQYIRNLPEEQQQTVMQNVIDKEKKYIEYLNKFLQTVGDKINLWYIEATEEHFKSHIADEEIPLDVIIPTKESLNGAIDNLKKNMYTYVTAQITHLESNDIPVGNIKALTEEYFLELQQLIGQKEERLVKAYAHLGPELGRLYVQKVAEGAKLQEEFNLQKELGIMPESKPAIPESYEKPDDIPDFSSSQRKVTPQQPPREVSLPDNRPDINILEPQQEIDIKQNKPPLIRRPADDNKIVEKIPSVAKKRQQQEFRVSDNQPQTTINKPQRTIKIPQPDIFAPVKLDLGEQVPKEYLDSNRGETTLPDPGFTTNPDLSSIRPTQPLENILDKDPLINNPSKDPLISDISFRTRKGRKDLNLDNL